MATSSFDTKSLGIRRDAGLVQDVPAGRIAPRSMEPHTLKGGRAVGVGLVLALGYYLLGEFALSLHFAQTGVSPIWPASGFAFALALWFGPGLAIAILPAMLALAWDNGIHWQTATLAGLASVLEAALPAWFLRSLSVSPALDRVRDVIAFMVVAVVIGPVISASVGTFAMAYWSASSPNWVATGLSWWMGNSIGMLVLGTVGLVLPFWWRQRNGQVGRDWGLLVLLLAAAVVTYSSVLLDVGIHSTLTMYLLIPIFIAAAIRYHQAGVALVALTGLIVLAMEAITVLMMFFHPRNWGRIS